MSEDAIRVLSGDCTVRFEAGADAPREERGTVLVVVKPDGTVLVHDRAGYRPAAWLTRADAVAVRDGDGGAVVDAIDGDRRLLVTCHDDGEVARHPVSGVGVPAGDCPACGGPLVRTPTAVTCLRCPVRHGVPRDATLLAEPCEACGAPTMRVERGAAFELCVDRRCTSLDDRVRERYDAAWACPACDAPLRILRRGGLIAGCAAYPDCEVAFALPAGLEDGDCGECGLPIFVTASGRRCLDTRCTTAE